MNHTVLAVGYFYECAELHNANDSAFVFLVHLKFHTDVFDNLTGFVNLVHIAVADEHFAVVFDVNLDASLVNDFIDSLTTSADDFSNLVWVDVEGNKVKVKLIGVCSACKNASMTIKGFVESVLRDKVDSAIEVEQV